jgi:hypothetical protein
MTEDANNTISSGEWPIPRLDDLTLARMRGEIPHSDADLADLAKSNELFFSEMLDRMTVRNEQRGRECMILVLGCYMEVLEKFDRDAAAAWRLFNGLLKVLKPPQKRRGKKDAVRDARLLVAYDGASWGEKEKAVASADGARTQRQVDAAVKHARRLVAAREVYRKHLDATANALADAILEAYRKGGPSAAAEAALAYARKKDK